MLATKPVIQALMTSFSSIFQGALEGTENYSESLVTSVSSSTATNTYGWMTRIMKMRKWVGPRRLQNLETEAYVLRNETYENTIAVDVNDIEDDNLGVYNPMMGELGRTSAKWKDQLFTEVLQANTLPGFDGKPLFAADHDLGGQAGVQGNVETSTPLSAENYEAAVAKMQSLKGNDGEPLAVNPDVILVPPQLRLTAKQILESETIAVGGAAVRNHLAGTARVVVAPELANQPGTWYLFDTTKSIKALICQVRQEPTLTQKTALTDDCVFEDDQFRMGVKARGAVGIGLWFLAHKASA